MLQNAHTVVWFISFFSNAFKIKDDSSYGELKAIKSYFLYVTWEKRNCCPVSKSLISYFCHSIVVFYPHHQIYVIV